MLHPIASLPKKCNYHRLSIRNRSNTCVANVRHKVLSTKEFSSYAKKINIGLDADNTVFVFP